MDATVVLLITVVGVIAAAAVLFLSTARRRDESRALEQSAPAEGTAGPVGAGPGLRGPNATTDLEPASTAPRATGRELERAVALERRGRGGAPERTSAPPPALPPDEETIGVTRRQVLNRGIVTSFSLVLASFGGASLAFLWPSLSGGFGSKISAGKLEEILAEYESTKEPFYLASGRFYIVPYPKEAVAKAKAVQAYSAVVDGYEQGIVALYQKCVHLGCRVPWCKSSQWFECPCHGSQYNRVGEKKGGPAPRGLDRFAVDVSGGVVSVDTSKVIDGPPIGTDTTGQEGEGPHCVGAGGH